MVRRLLLACGVGAPTLYAVADLVAGLTRPGYSFRDQAISELGAIGAPTRSLFSALVLVSYVLLTAFGYGVWRHSGTSRRLRVVGGLILTLGLMALAVGWLVPMRSVGAFAGTRSSRSSRCCCLARGALPISRLLDPGMSPPGWVSGSGSCGTATSSGGRLWRCNSSGKAEPPPRRKRRHATVRRVAGTVALPRKPPNETSQRTTG